MVWEGLEEKTGKLRFGLLINEFPNNGTQAEFPGAGPLKILFPCCQRNTRTDAVFGWEMRVLRFGDLEFSTKPRLVSNLWQSSCLSFPSARITVMRYLPCPVSGN